MPTLQMTQCQASSLRASTCSILAQRMQQKWLSQHPNEQNPGPGLDDSLTNLGWLQNLRLLEFSQGQLPSLELVQEKRTALQSVKCPQTPELRPGLQLASAAPPFGLNKNVLDYKNNPHVKPPYSYTTLICMAMQTSRHNKMTLSAIYNYIKEHFLYYRLADPSWQNSIRHNLSLNKCFEKVPRQKDEPGKGGFWRVNPEYGSLSENGTFKKRQTGWSTGPPVKRVRLLEDTTPLAPGMKSGAREDKMLSSLPELDMVEHRDDGFYFWEDSRDWDGLINKTDLVSDPIGGCSLEVKEEILDDSFAVLSPPSCDGVQDLSCDLFPQAEGLYTAECLDLTVSGTSIRPPDWWEVAARSAELQVSNSRDRNLHTPVPSGRSLHTPVPQVSLPAEAAYSIWEDTSQASEHNFDLDDLFDYDSMSI